METAGFSGALEPQTFITSFSTTAMLLLAMQMYLLYAVSLGVQSLLNLQDKRIQIRCGVVKQNL